MIFFKPHRINKKTTQKHTNTKGVCVLTGVSLSHKEALHADFHIHTCQAFLVGTQCGCVSSTTLTCNMWHVDHRSYYCGFTFVNTQQRVGHIYKLV